MELEQKAQFKPDTALGYRHERVVGDPSCGPYLERWIFNLGPFAIRLHHFFRSDEDHLHDHPWAFLTLVLKGSYTDVSSKYFDQHLCNVKLDRLRPGSVRYRSAYHAHRVVTDGCWTLLLSKRKSRDWGFWVDGKWKRQRRYFREHPSHPCD